MSEGITKSRVDLGMVSGFGRSDSSVLLDLLQGANYDPAFWPSLSVQDALGLDYKDIFIDDTFVSLLYRVSLCVLLLHIQRCNAKRLLDRQVVSGGLI